LHFTVKDMILLKVFLALQHVALGMKAIWRSLGSNDCGDSAATNNVIAV